MTFIEFPIVLANMLTSSGGLALARPTVSAAEPICQSANSRCKYHPSRSASVYPVTPVWCHGLCVLGAGCEHRGSRRSVTSTRSSAPSHLSRRVLFIESCQDEPERRQAVNTAGTPADMLFCWGTGAVITVLHVCTCYSEWRSTKLLLQETAV